MRQTARQRSHGEGHEITVPSAPRRRVRPSKARLREKRSPNERASDASDPGATQREPPDGSGPQIRPRRVLTHPQNPQGPKCDTPRTVQLGPPMLGGPFAVVRREGGPDTTSSSFVRQSQLLPFIYPPTSLW